MPNTPQPLPMERPTGIDELMKGLEYAGFSSVDKGGNWKMMWFKPLLDYVRQLEASAMQARDARALEVVEQLIAALKLAKQNVHAPADYDGEKKIKSWLWQQREWDLLITKARQYINEMKG